MAQPQRSKYDELHDRFDPIATPKSGTRYERLVAIVQKALNKESDARHDLRLIGRTTVKHQIDVTTTRLVETKSGSRKQTRRVLIECKDFEVSGKKVGLGIIRDFFGVVDDVKPDEAIVITCNGFTRSAMKYAKAKKIKLAVLRGHSPDDDEGRITGVDIVGEIANPVGLTPEIKFVDAEGLSQFSAAPVGEKDEAQQQWLYPANRAREALLPALERLFNSSPHDDDQILPDARRRKNVTLSGHSVQNGNGPRIPINGFFINYRLETRVMRIHVESPVVALILKPIGKGDDLLIFERDLKRFRIDPKTGAVLER